MLRNNLSLPLCQVAVRRPMAQINKNMKYLSSICWILLLASSSLWGQDGPQRVSFPSLDGVEITADMYVVADSLPVMLLCHQAGYSRGEYIESAPRFNELGFNCLAIDLRSGKEVNGVKNKTAWDAREKRRPVNYLDAEMDMVAAINYLVVKYKQDVILVGSSYSASLALKLAKEHDRVRAAIVFSPGEYFGQALNLTAAIAGLNKPVFATSSRGEAESVRNILKGVPHAVQFVPKAAGAHGSKVLWSTHKGQEEYWEALIPFLQELKQTPTSNK